MEMRKTLQLQKLVVLILSMTLLMTCMPVHAASPQTEVQSVSSASASKASVYKKAYKQLLEKKSITMSTKNGPYEESVSTMKIQPKSFMLLDVNRDGTPELIISDDVPDASSSTRLIYTMKNSKAVFSGYYTERGGNIVQYSKKNKAILNTWWTAFVEGAGARLLRISNYKLTFYHGIYSSYEKMFSSRKVYRYGKGNVVMKDVSKAKYDAIQKKYFSDKITMYKFTANTAANRNKLLK